MLGPGASSAFRGSATAFAAALVVAAVLAKLLLVVQVVQHAVVNGALGVTAGPVVAAGADRGVVALVLGVETGLEGVVARLHALAAGVQAGVVLEIHAGNGVVH